MATQFELPNLTGNGGACTSTLLKVLYRNKQAAAPKNWVECLRTMRTELKQMGYIQIPELTSSRLIDVNQPMHIVPPGSTGRRLAILIGINYVGQQLVSFLVVSFSRILSHPCANTLISSKRSYFCYLQPGSHNDVKNIKHCLIDVQGFKESDLYILMDDGGAILPTKRNIEYYFARICQHSVAGDVVFVHYSGHGGRVSDTNGDEEDGLDSTLLPVDYLTAGQIVDDDST
jgi:Caspase domain